MITFTKAFNVTTKNLIVQVDTALFFGYPFHKNESGETTGEILASLLLSFGKTFAHEINGLFASELTPTFKQTETGRMSDLRGRPPGSRHRRC